MSQIVQRVVGEFLNEVYLQNRQSMRMDDTEGGSTIIDRLDIKTIESMQRLKEGGITRMATC